MSQWNDRCIICNKKVEGENVVFCHKCVKLPMKLKASKLRQYLYARPLGRIC